MQTYKIFYAIFLFFPFLCIFVQHVCFIRNTHTHTHTHTHTNTHQHVLYTQTIHTVLHSESTKFSQRYCKTWISQQLTLSLCNTSLLIFTVIVISSITITKIHTHTDSRNRATSASVDSPFVSLTVFHSGRTSLSVTATVLGCACTAAVCTLCTAAVCTLTWRSLMLGLKQIWTYFCSLCVTHKNYYHYYNYHYCLYHNNQFINTNKFSVFSFFSTLEAL